jgi:hypothetical protein
MNQEDGSRQEAGAGRGTQDAGRRVSRPLLSPQWGRDVYSTPTGLSSLSSFRSKEQRHISLLKERKSVWLGFGFYKHFAPTGARISVLCGTSNLPLRPVSVSPSLSSVLILVVLCATSCVLCASVVENGGRHSPQRHRDHRGRTEIRN